MDYILMHSMYLNELCHSRTKGSKNGERLYQLEDGTYTEEGKARKRAKYAETHKYKESASELSDDELTKRNARLIKEKQYENLNKNPEEKSRDYGSDVSNMTRSVSNLTRSVSDSLPTKNGKTIRKDYSDMSDEELRKKINRILLEKQYGDLSGDTKYVESGSEKTKKILETVGHVVDIAGAMAAIGFGIYGIASKNKKGAS